MRRELTAFPKDNHFGDRPTNRRQPGRRLVMNEGSVAAFALGVRHQILVPGNEIGEEAEVLIRTVLSMTVWEPAEEDILLILQSRLHHPRNVVNSGVQYDA